MLLDVAGYGLFDNAGNALSTAGNVALGGLAIFFGFIALVWLALLGIAGIAVVSFRRGMVNRSVPKGIGMFFRLSGILLGVLLAFIFLPFALLFKLSTATILITVAAIVVAGFFIGRTISKLIGMRLRRYGYYVRTADTVRGRIMRLVYSV